MNYYYLFLCSKRRKAEKVGKGLRHFSMKVCEKVKKKGTTSYNEVADELVGEFTNPAHINSLTDQVFVSLYSHINYKHFENCFKTCSFNY